MFKPAHTNRNTLGRVPEGGRSSTHCPMRLTSSHTHTPSSLTLPGTCPKVNRIPEGLEALTESCCFFSHWKCQPSRMPKPDPSTGHSARAYSEWPSHKRRGHHHLPRPADQGLKPGTQSHGVHPTAATQSALQASVQASTGPSIWGSLFATFLVPALKPSSQQPPPAHRPAEKLLPSCGGASSPPSNAPSNRITSAPSGPMRAENSCAPASRCEPRARGASETGGTDLQEPGLPAELQLPPLPLSRRSHRRRCRRQCPSEEWQRRKSGREHLTPRLYETGACSGFLVSGPSLQGMSELIQPGARLRLRKDSFLEGVDRDVFWDPTPPQPLKSS